jgi:hypothetical protein
VANKVSIVVNLHSKRRTRFYQNTLKVCPNLTRNSFLADFLKWKE